MHHLHFGVCSHEHLSNLTTFGENLVTPENLMLEPRPQQMKSCADSSLLTKLHRGKNKQDAKRSSNNEEKQQ
jgi:hypothetical protein